MAVLLENVSTLTRDEIQRLIKQAAPGVRELERKLDRVFCLGPDSHRVPLKRRQQERRE